MAADTQIQGLARIETLKERRPGYFEMNLEAPWIARAARPAQFVHVDVSNRYHPLLRRPISVFETDGRKHIRLLWRVEGEGTELLSRKGPGQTLDVLGPRGKAFTVPEAGTEVPLFLVGGGIGIPPIFFLSRELKNARIKHRVFLGAQSEAHLLALEDFAGIDQPVMIATDDGSAGEKGMITSPLFSAIDSKDRSAARIYACGPTPMLRAISGFCGKREWVQAELSLEARMSCALGACMGCVVKTVRGYERVCTEGPVFQARDLVW